MNATVDAGGAFSGIIVKVALATELSVIPDLDARAFTVELAVRVIGVE